MSVAMATLMPQGVFSHATWSRPTASSRAFTRPKLVEKTDPKMIATATIEVTFGRKKAKR
jgi:hypothetical protein